MTRRWFVSTYLSVLGVGLTALVHPTPRLICNASASVPIGLYAVHPVGVPRIGEVLVVIHWNRSQAFSMREVICRKHRLCAEGEHVAGTYRQCVTLSSGRFAMIDEGLSFQFVPWGSSLGRRWRPPCQ